MAELRNLIVTGATSLSGTLNVNGSTNLSGNTTIGGTLGVTGTVTFSSYLTSPGGIHITKDTDVELSTYDSDPLTIGSKTSTNIGIDDNEIQARNNGAVSPLYLNANGGKVYFGGTYYIDGGDYTGTAANAGNADTVDNYHASSLWRSDGGTWNPNANISLTATGNNQEWSFDIDRNNKTGCYWHVWDKTFGTLLKVNADDGVVSAPKGGFSGGLNGHASSDLALSGGTMTGYLTLVGNKYSREGALNCNNSDIIGANAIVFGDNSERGEGLIFTNSSSNYDSLRMEGGHIKFTVGSKSSSCGAGDGTEYELWIS